MLDCGLEILRLLTFAAVCPRMLIVKSISLRPYLRNANFPVSELRHNRMPALEAIK